MSMSIGGMQTALNTAIATALTGAGTMANSSAFASALASGIANALVPYITSNAVVAGTATGAMGGGPGVPVVGTVS